VIEDVKTFQRFLVGYQIHVISREHFNGIVYHGPTADKKIYLYYHDNHYDVITSMTVFSLIVNLSTIMAYVVASVFFFGVITFVAVCTEIVTTQEHSHAGNHIVVIVMVVQVNLLIGCGSIVNNSKIHDQTEDDWIHCQDCGRYFKGPTCFNLHNKTTPLGNSTCTSYYKCKNCGQQSVYKTIIS
jgi:fatty acid desaturase